MMKKFILIAVLFGACAYGANQPVKTSAAENVKTDPVCDIKDLMIECSDQTIRCEVLSSKLAVEGKELKKQLRDPGFLKCLISFHEIPGHSPYSILMKRGNGEFVPCSGREDAMSLAVSKIMKTPFFYLVSAKGFLPGEKVTFRLTSKDKDVFKEVSLYPRPLVLRKPSGELLFKATFASSLQDITMYNIEISGIDEKEKFDFLSLSGKEKMNHPLQGPVVMNYMPSVIGESGGVSQIFLNFKDGSSYKVELPWGMELVKYAIGDK